MARKLFWGFLVVLRYGALVGITLAYNFGVERNTYLDAIAIIAMLFIVQDMVYKARAIKMKRFQDEQ